MQTAIIIIFWEVWWPLDWKSKSCPGFRRTQSRWSRWKLTKSENSNFRRQNLGSIDWWLEVKLRTTEHSSYFSRTAFRRLARTRNCPSCINSCIPGAGVLCQWILIKTRIVMWPRRKKIPQQQPVSSDQILYQWIMIRLRRYIKIRLRWEWVEKVPRLEIRYQQITTFSIKIAKRIWILPKIMIGNKKRIITIIIIIRHEQEVHHLKESKKKWRRMKCGSRQQMIICRPHHRIHNLRNNNNNRIRENEEKHHKWLLKKGLIPVRTRNLKK